MPAPARMRSETGERENGYSLVAGTGGTVPPGKDLKTISGITGITTDELKEIFTADAHLPLLRTGTPAEAEAVRRDLAAAGLEARIVADAELEAENPPRRLGGLEFLPDRLTLFLFDRREMVEIARDDLVLIVTGRIFEQRTEAVRKHRRLGRRTRPAPAEETDAGGFEEFVLDLYGGDEAGRKGYRIRESGFDFSCLGAAKGILARENMPRLVKRIRQAAPEAAFVGDYQKVRRFLENIWETEQKTVSGGFRRRGIGDIDLENVSTIDNLAQYTRYSRLQRFLI